VADDPRWDDIFTSQPTPADSRRRDDRQPPGESTTSDPAAETPAPAAPLGSPPPESRRAQRERERNAEAQEAMHAPPSPATPQPAPPSEDPEPHEALLATMADDEHGQNGRRATREPSRPRERASREPRERGRHRGTIILVSILVVVLAGGTAGVFAAWGTIAPIVARFSGDDAPADFTGSGNGEEVDFAIVDGQVGSDIAANLADSGVTKSYEAAYSILLTDETLTFQPGTYALQKEMSAQAAIDALQDDANRIVNRLVIPEGTAAVDIYSLLSEATDIPLDQVTAAAADVASFGLPADATSLEGYLFPATYDLDPDLDAHGYLQLMVDTQVARLTALGVQPADYQRVITLASIVQREAGLAADYPKVSRVFLNRLDDGMLLQSDATVAYGTGNTHRVTTTDEERGDASNPYNTYMNEGLPVGPISNPGDLALDAAVKPADGTWRYFVTVNLDSGETTFSTTFAEHEVAVAQWQAWMREHPEYQ
jgi:UPF0755 protein